MFLEDCNIISSWEIVSLKNYIYYNYSIDGQNYLYKGDLENCHKLLNSNNKVKILIEFIKKVHQKIEGHKFVYYLLSNVSTLAAILGYDAIELISAYEQKSNFSFLILNRGKLKIDKSFHKKLNRVHNKTNTINESQNKQLQPQ